MLEQPTMTPASHRDADATADAGELDAAKPRDLRATHQPRLQVLRPQGVDRPARPRRAMGGRDLMKPREIAMSRRAPAMR